MQIVEPGMQRQVFKGVNMGLHLPPKATLDGVLISSIQKSVRRYGWLDHGDGETSKRGWKFAMESDLALRALVNAGGAVSAGEQGFSGSEIYDLTDFGNALMSARLRKRTPLKKADGAWLELKDGISKLNSTELVEVMEVWIFGSYMRRAAEIGDIDAVIFTEWVAPDFKTLTQGVARKFADEAWLQRAMDNLYGSGKTPAEEMTHRLIFGNRRKPIFDSVELASFRNQEFSELRAGMPAQRVYTKSGGWITEDPVERHSSAEAPMERPHRSVRIDQGEFSSLNLSKEAGPLRGSKV
jgi:predicted nucleotidyltransferase